MDILKKQSKKSTDGMVTRPKRKHVP